MTCEAECARQTFVVCSVTEEVFERQTFVVCSVTEVVFVDGSFRLEGDFVPALSDDASIEFINLRDEINDAVSLHMISCQIPQCSSLNMAA